MLTRYVLLDLETIAAPDVRDWLPPVEADKRLTDVTKIHADLALKLAVQLEMAPLDPDLCQIAAFGWQTEAQHEPMTLLCTAPGDEAAGLNVVWSLLSKTRPMVGYGLTWFDAGVLVRRSQLLGVLIPSWIYTQGKYRHDCIVELSDYLTLNGMIEQKKGRTLDYHCRRFGIYVEDAISGKDVGKAWADERYDTVRLHLEADIRRIRQLAERLKVIPSTPAEADACEADAEEQVVF